MYRVVFENVYKYFRTNIQPQAVRPTILFNEKPYFLYVNVKNTKYSQIEPDIFWHLCSIEEGTEEVEELDEDELQNNYKYSAYPCTNTSDKKTCLFQCEKNHIENPLLDGRIPCSYRANRISNIINTINLHNNNSSKTKHWIAYNGQTKTKNLYILYEGENIYYVVIAQIRYNKDKTIKFFYLSTAFPVVAKSFFRRFNRDYCDYQSYCKKNSKRK